MDNVFGLLPSETCILSFWKVTESLCRNKAKLTLNECTGVFLVKLGMPDTVIHVRNAEFFRKWYLGLVYIYIYKSLFQTEICKFYLFENMFTKKHIY